VSTPLSPDSSPGRLENPLRVRVRRPHVLFIVENSTVPMDVRVWREARFARGRGFHVSVIAPRTPDYPLTYEVLEGIEIYRHPICDRWSGAGGQLAEYGSALVHETLLSVKIFRRRPFQVIHGANPPDHLFLIALLFRPFGVKYVFDHHDLAPELYLTKFGGRKTILYRGLRLMERLSCRTAHAVISTNRSYQRHVIERYGIDVRKMFVVRNDPEVTQEPTLVAPRAAGVGAARTRLLYLGSINTQDGVDLLVRSLHLLVHELGERDFRCDILGDGDDLKRVRELCTDLGMDPYVHFAGFVRDKKTILAHIRAADICLESAPLNEVNTKSTFIKVMEYMAQAKPIVAFDLPETRISTGPAAILVRPNDQQQFAQAVQTLIRNPARRGDLGRLGRQRIVSELNWGRSAEALSRTYDTILPFEDGEGLDR
jgi:glycosyltransferase involved in cell wall biosynthesis